MNRRVQADNVFGMTYAEAMEKYGSDKPDLRIPLQLVTVGDLMQDVEFKVFSGPANDPHGRVAALKVPRGKHKSKDHPGCHSTQSGNAHLLPECCRVLFCPWLTSL